jgi:hypothetical protein
VSQAARVLGLSDELVKHALSYFDSKGAHARRPGLRSFEQDAGQSNRQTFRMETNATFGVERLSAGLRII